MSVADDLVAAHAPWLTPDLETYLRQVGGMFSEVELFSDDIDGRPGWSILLDVDRAPARVLPHLAMYVGETLPVGISEVMAREWIRDAPNQIRGTVASIVRTAQRTLTGQRTVSLVERQGSDGLAHADRIRIVTYTSETPDPAATERDLRRDAIPGDIVMFYERRTGQAWADVQAKTIDPPTGLAATPSGTGGALAGGTYYYKVTALNASGETIGSAEVSAVVPAGTTGSVALTWTAAAGATGYRVYRGTATGTQDVYYALGNVTAFTDTGAAGTAGTVPTTNTALFRWSDVARVWATWEDVRNERPGFTTYTRPRP